jgi:hypothetical protein
MRFFPADFGLPTRNRKEISMSFFKNLFGKRKDTASTPKQEDVESNPIPAQVEEVDASELEPIVVQAIESLFPNEADQKQAIGFSIRYKKYQKADTLRLLLSLLAYSNGKIDKLLATENGAIRNYQFMLDEIAPRFTDLKAAEDWVRSITRTQV